MSALAKARAAEAASKEALRTYCQESGWKIAFFEGSQRRTSNWYHRCGCFPSWQEGCGRTGSSLSSVKGGKAGVNGSEIARLKKAASNVAVKWVIAAYDGETMHVLPDDPEM